MDKVKTVSPFLPALHENRCSETTKYLHLGVSVQRLLFARPLKRLSMKTNTTFSKHHPGVQEDLLGIQAPSSHKSLGTKSIPPARRFSGPCLGPAQGAASTRPPEPRRSRPTRLPAFSRTPVCPAPHPTYAEPPLARPPATDSIVCVPGRRRSLAAFSRPFGVVLRLERAISACRLVLRLWEPFRICSPHRIRIHSLP